MHPYACVSSNPLCSFVGLSARGLSGTYLSRACERNLVYANVRSYCRPCCWSIPRQNIDDSGWKASLRNTHWRMVRVNIPFQAAWALLHRFHMKEARQAPAVCFAYLLDEGSHVQGAERCLLCRLDHHCVTTAQCGSDFPGEHQQGEVPLEGKSEVSRRGTFSMTYYFFSSRDLSVCQILKIVLNINLLHCQV